MKGLAASLAIVLALPLAVRSAQQDRRAQSAEQRPVFRSGIDLVQVDAVVVDRAGRPITDLTAADFEILDNGRPQAIVAFERVETPLEPIDSRAAERPSPDVVDNRAGADRAVILVLDNLRLTGGLLESTMLAAGRIIDRLERGTPVALMRTGGGGSEFTTDRAVLRANIDGVRSYASAFPGRPSTTDLKLFFDQVTTLRILTDLVKYLERSPRPRKAVVFISPGLRLFHVPIREDSDALGTEADNLIEKALKADAAIYCIDPRNPALFDAESGALAAPHARRSTLEALAKESGGLAILQAATPQDAADYVVREIGTYYLLGFYPDDAPGRGKYRPVEVRVKRTDATVRAKPGYTIEKTPPAAQGDKDLGRFVEGIIHRSELPLRVFTAPVDVVKKDVRLAIAMEVGLGFGQDRRDERLAYVLAAVDLKRRKLHSASWRDARFVVEEDELTGATHPRYRFVTDLVLPPGRYQLRIAARSQAGLRTGSGYVDVEVPDLDKVPFALGSMVLGYADAKGDDRLNSRYLPFPPTLDRSFGSTAQLRVFAQILSRKPAAFAAQMTLVDSDGAERWQHSIGALTSDRLEALLPLAGLPPGRYRLKVRADGANHTDSRQIEISVQ